MAKNSCYVRATTLLYAAYVIMALDVILFVEWVAGSIYLARNCPELLETNLIFFCTHFIQLITVYQVVCEWNTNLAEPPHRVKDTRPPYWILVSILCLTGDAFLLTSALYTPQPALTCDYNTLHRVLDGQGVAICSISILWWCVSAVLTRDTQKAQASEREEALRDPQNKYNAPLLPINKV